MSLIREESGEFDPGALPRVSVTAAQPEAVVASDLFPGTPILSIDELDTWNVPARVRAIMEKGEDSEHPKAGDNSRSTWVFDFACQMLRCEVPAPTIMAILLDPRWAIAASVLEKGGGAQRAAHRAIENARERVEAARSEFHLNDRYKPLPSQRNIVLGVSKLAISLSYDQFAGRALISGLPGHGPRLDDDALRRLWLLNEQQHGFRPAKDYFGDVVIDLAYQNEFHPVLDYLSGLAWDGQPRLASWPITYGGADDTPFVRAVASKVLMAAVRRVREPGCKFDEMLVLEGPQGACKSSAIAILAGSPNWYTDDVCLDGDGKLALEQLSGKWFVEVAELAGMRKGEVEKIKAFLSRCSDQGRPAYGRLVQERPRQCVFIGTTNNDAYLRDTTGNRRFWPVRIQRFDLEALARDRDQLWAEAAHREAMGESIQLDEALWADAAAVQAERRVIDPFVEVLSNKLGDASGKILGADVWKLLEIPPERQPQHAQRMGDAMRELGWQRKQLRFGGSNPQWGYARGAGQRLEIRPHFGGEWVLSGSSFNQAA